MSADDQHVRQHRRAYLLQLFDRMDPHEQRHLLDVARDLVDIVPFSEPGSLRERFGLAPKEPV